MWYCCAFILPFSLFLCAVLKVLRDFIKLKRQLLAQMGVFVCECVGFLIIHQFGLFYIDFRFCKHLMCHVEYFDSWRWCFRHKAIRFMFHLEEICFFFFISENPEPTLEKILNFFMVNNNLMSYSKIGKLFFFHIAFNAKHFISFHLNLWLLFVVLQTKYLRFRSIILFFRMTFKIYYHKNHFFYIRGKNW